MRTFPGGESVMKVQLAVLRVEGSWRLLVNGEGLGRFPRRSAAVNCASEIARFARAEGTDVDLLAQTEFGELIPLPALARAPH
jgi:hypothetical protein